MLRRGNLTFCIFYVCFVGYLVEDYLRLCKQSSPQNQHESLNHL